MSFGADMSSPSRGSSSLNEDSPTSRRSTPRRSSSRSIKRKKFDDELVESALKKPDHVRRSSECSQTDGKVRKPLSKGSSKKRSKDRQQPVSSDYGRWRPTDDLALITAVQQTNDLHAVHMSVKFSCRFSLKDVQERWHSLLYDPVVSRLSQQGMKSLPADIASSIQQSALWSKDEEKLLMGIPSTTIPAISQLEEMLAKHIRVFHKCRTPKSLLNHWHLLKHYQLLSDQTMRPIVADDVTTNITEMQAKYKDEDLLNSRDDDLDQEVAFSDRQSKREIQRLEAEIPKWQAIVDKLTGNDERQEFDQLTHAVLRGRIVRYLVKSKEVVIGRNASDSHVDVDLSLEGPAWKISRKQGRILMAEDNQFTLLNEGRRPFYVNGVPVVCGTSKNLPHNSTIEISGFRFLFLINPKLLVENHPSPGKQSSPQHPSTDKKPQTTESR